VIAFERGSMAELITEGVTGRLVTDVDGAVDAVATNGDVDRAAIRSVAVERFGVDRMVDEYVEVYRSLLR
jgi:glycosyltransferase involved in cell wall biosynthesis